MLRRPLDWATVRVEPTSGRIGESMRLDKQSDLLEAERGKPYCLTRGPGYVSFRYSAAVSGLGHSLRVSIIPETAALLGSSSNFRTRASAHLRSRISAFRASKWVRRKPTTAPNGPRPTAARHGSKLQYFYRSLTTDSGRWLLRIQRGMV